MGFPEGLDYDRVLGQFLPLAAEAMKGWLGGRPKSEEAFMNQLTSQVTKRRRACDVGARTTASMTADVGILHRQDTNSEDLYGSDLAVTIQIDNPSLVKTALFQIKRTSNFRGTIVAKQLRDAVQLPITAGRSFVMAVDDEREALRIHSVPDLLASIQDGVVQPTIDSAGWDTAARWLWRWFSCEVGMASTPGNGPSIEGMLQKFVVDGSVARRASPLWHRDPPIDLPENALPARTWLRLFFSVVPSGLGEQEPFTAF